MKGLRVHIPPSERCRRLVILLPISLGLLGFVAMALSWAPSGDEKEKIGSLFLTGLGVLSFGPLLGILLWARSDLRKFRARRARLTAEGLVVRDPLLGPRTLPWSHFESFSLLRAGQVLFGLFTPRGEGATWVVEASEAAEEALCKAIEERPEGEARFVYQSKVLAGWPANLWMVGGLVLGVSLALVRLDGGTHDRCCLWFPMAPIYALFSLGFLGAFLVKDPTRAILRVVGKEGSFVLPDRRAADPVRAIPGNIAGYSEIDDPSGLRDRRFALPRGSLSQDLQVSLIEQLLLPDEEELPEEAPAGWDVAPPPWVPPGQEASGQGELAGELPSAVEVPPAGESPSTSGVQPALEVPSGEAETSEKKE